MFSSRVPVEKLKPVRAASALPSHEPRDGLAGNVRVHQLLIPGVAELDDDVVDHAGNGAVSEQRREEILCLR
jgi:hypothetical protein